MFTANKNVALFILWLLFKLFYLDKKPMLSVLFCLIWFHTCFSSQIRNAVNTTRLLRPLQQPVFSHCEVPIGSACAGVHRKDGSFRQACAQTLLRGYVDSVLIQCCQKNQIIRRELRYITHKYLFWYHFHKWSGTLVYSNKKKRQINNPIHQNQTTTMIPKSTSST